MLTRIYGKHKSEGFYGVGMRTKIDSSQEYEITEITKSEYEDELVMAVNVN